MEHNFHLTDMNLKILMANRLKLKEDKGAAKR